MAFCFHSLRTVINTKIITKLSWNDLTLFIAFRLNKIDLKKKVKKQMKNCKTSDLRRDVGLQKQLACTY